MTQNLNTVTMMPNLDGGVQTARHLVVKSDVRCRAQGACWLAQLGGSQCPCHSERVLVVLQPVGGRLLRSLQLAHQAPDEPSTSLQATGSPLVASLARGHVGPTGSGLRGRQLWPASDGKRISELLSMTKLLPWRGSGGRRRRSRASRTRTCRGP